MSHACSQAPSIYINPLFFLSECFAHSLSDQFKLNQLDASQNGFITELEIDEISKQVLNFQEQLFF